ncbi:MAG: haloacid dehalogenase type II [Acidobacteria bacterium]|nr:haloacid dehalogenase type II [Acidobacteriota bacterium]
MSRPALLAFDVNETLLSLAPIKARFEEAFGIGAPVGEWFSRMLHGSLVANHVGDYRSFAEIGIESLLTVSKKRGLAMRGEDAASIVSAMTSLPPHPEVHDALQRLFDADFAMVALTNGSTSAANEQMENAGLHTFLRRVISVEEVGRFKPAPEPYQHAADVMGVELADMMLVAAHDWDCAGAVAAGAQSAFVQRSDVVWSLPGEPPELVVDDIAGLADALID